LAPLFAALVLGSALAIVHGKGASEAVDFMWIQWRPLTVGIGLLAMTLCSEYVSDQARSGALWGTLFAWVITPLALEGMGSWTA
tara:strand:+ start:45551 stop:45802 length:252 start_codon:yes stop_codon:yes gene_type:complete